MESQFLRFTADTGEVDFICNLKSCRRPIVNAGWVTSCSHMFCEEDGQERFRQDGQGKCPVCDTLLPNKYDMVHVNLNPSEEFKSMVLAGLRPEVILEITGRAMSFWSYQVFSERSTQERAARKYAEHAETMQTKHEAEMHTALKKSEAIEKENQTLHFQIQGLRDLLAERGRQLQKAQSTVTKLLRTVAHKSSGSPRSDGISPSKASSTGSSPGNVFSREQSEYEASLTPTKSHNDPGFTFRPALNARGKCNPPLFPVTKK